MVRIIQLLIAYQFVLVLFGFGWEFIAPASGIAQGLTLAYLRKSRKEDKKGDLSDLFK